MYLVLTNKLAICKRHLVLTVSNNVKKTSSQPCVRLTTCVGHSASPLMYVGISSSPLDLEGDKWFRKWMEGRMDGNTSSPFSITFLHFLSQDRTGAGWCFTSQLLLIHLRQIRDFLRRDG